MGVGISGRRVADQSAWWPGCCSGRAGAYQSITLEADAHHLMSDVWTSAGVVVGVGAAALTGWQRLDPIIAIRSRSTSCARA